MSDNDVEQFIRIYVFDQLIVGKSHAELRGLLEKWATQKQQEAAQLAAQKQADLNEQMLALRVAQRRARLNAQVAANRGAQLAAKQAANPYQNELFNYQEIGLTRPDWDVLI